MFSLIHPSRIESVKAALKIAFNNDAIHDLSLLAGGYSASKTYKFFQDGKPYVLRVMSFETTADDRKQQIFCLKKASEAEIAPHCYYGDAETGIVIMQYIQPAPMVNRQAWLMDLAKTLRTLHSLELFASVHYDSIFTYMDGLSENVRKHALSPLIKNYLDTVQATQKKLSPGLIKKSCHNDLNPNNLIFDGQKIYLVDWEAAGAEDPMFDVATVCNQMTFNESEKDYFLQHYFGYLPKGEEEEKLNNMRQVSYCYYGLHFLGFAQAAGISLEHENSVNAFPTLNEWVSAYMQGQYGLETPQDFVRYGMMQIKEALTLLLLNSSIAGGKLTEIIR